MDVPRFARAELNARLVEGELDEAFPRFAGDVFARDLPGLHIFPTGGKDGAIDFVREAPSRAVGDFKFLSADGIGPARSAWREVAGRLRKHLESPSGPSQGQAQYAPWYRTDNPIQTYHFCLSSRVKNLNQEDDLSKEIEQFFLGLARLHTHLAHLANLSVHIHDWGDIERLLIEQPHLLLRWFPRSRPRGLVPLDETAGLTSFRAYLRSEKLPYYSRAEHRRREPLFPNELVEEEILRQIDHRQVTGLLITGSGGVGKSRLSMELGSRAAAAGALVLRTVGRVAIDELTRLGERLNPDTPCLILVEYVETQSDFDALVDCINTLNDTYGLRIGYVATCRTSHYGTVAGLTRHVRLDLTPPSGSMEQGVQRLFRKGAVEHILTQSVGVTDESLRVCRDSPVLAVFLAYLRERGREPDLAELLHERDFGSWVARRIQASFGTREIGRDVATLIGQLPFDDAVAVALPPDSRVLFDRLAADGWIERDDPAGDGSLVWSSIHDVLADQILLGYLSRIPSTVDLFVRDLLRHAGVAGTLTASIVSLQRIHGEPPLAMVDWTVLLEGEVRRDPATWFPARLLLLRTSLVASDIRLHFLSEDLDPLWAGVDDEVDLHNVLGYFARLEVRDPTMTSQSRKNLVRWIGRVAPRVNKSNFVLTWGLRLGVEEVRGPAREWLISKPSMFQTHYLLGAWLQTGMGPSDVEVTTKRWLISWKVSFHAQFVYRGWLDAKGALEIVEEPIKDWLAHENNRLNPEAQFVYRPWLDAKGALEVVEEPIKDWLAHENNRLIPEAQFVYRAWLDAKGALEVVEEPIKDWLAHEHNRLIPEARFVYGAWLDAKGALEVVEEPIKDWLAHENNRLIPEASFVYRGWLDAKGALEVVEEPIKDWLAHENNRLIPEASFVYRGWLDRTKQTVTIEKPLAEWLVLNGTARDSDHVYHAWLQAGGRFDFVRAPVLEWLMSHRLEQDAVYLLKYVVKQRVLPDDVTQKILAWCSDFAADPDAIWRLSTLTAHVGHDLALEVLRTSESVLEPILANPYLPGLTRSQVTTVLGNLSRLEPLCSEPLSRELNALLRRWISHPQSFEASFRHGPHHQTRRFLARLVAALEGEARTSGVSRLMTWVDSWDERIRIECSDLIARLHTLNPD
jgi:hypothetical protein